MTSHNSPFSKNKEAPAGEEVLSGYFPLREFKGREVALTGELPLGSGTSGPSHLQRNFSGNICAVHTRTHTHRRVPVWYK